MMLMAEQQVSGVENLNKEISSVIQAQEEKKQVVKQRRKVVTKQKVFLTKGKRKRAVARARLMKGNGVVTINNVDVKLIKPKEIRSLIMEPINFSSLTKSIAQNSNIKVNVHGGGTSSQAQAVRTAIAKAIAAASASDIIRKAYLKYDRNLIVDDVRQVEPKKFLGTKARARFQKSYR
jgi:small subunit ribosomal protein S9